jgi:hypothetical protein
MEKHLGNSKPLIVEELNLESLSVEDLLAQRENDFLNTDDLNVFYSYPYFSRGDIDYQYRLFVEDDKLVLEDVRCDDTTEDDINSIIVNSEVARVDTKKGLELIQANCDLMSGEKLNITTDILKYDFDGANEEDIKSTIINNKNIVLLELYKNFF